MTNRYGVDVSYFSKELDALKRTLDDRTPEELERYFLRLVDVARPIKSHNKQSTPCEAHDMVYTEEYRCTKCGFVSSSS